jgi:hypothetical protein
MVGRFRQCLGNVFPLLLQQPDGEMGLVGGRLEPPEEVLELLDESDV